MDSWPYLAQPKLNGIRAKWTGEYIITRQGNVVSPAGLPHLYEKLTEWSDKHHGVVLDGELYCHGMPFEDIAGLCSVNRNDAGPGYENIDLHAFDIISDEHTEERQIMLMHMYKPWVACAKVHDTKEAMLWLKTFNNNGFEGMILREYNRPYIAGRTKAVIKLKPMQYGHATVVKVIEGEGKFRGMMGSFLVVADNIEFNVGGGFITAAERQLVWDEKKDWKGRKILIQFRDKFESGKPVQPQIAKLWL